MERLVALMLLAVISVVSAQTVKPSNSSVSTKDAIQLAFQKSLTTRWDLFPLIPSAANIQESKPLQGSLVLTTPNSTTSVTSGTIALVQCDPSAYVGYIGAVETIARAIDRQASAVVLWSNTSATCIYSTGADIPSMYPYLYSMTSSQQTRSLMGQLLAGSDSSIYIAKRSTFDNSTQSGLNTGSGTSGGSQPQPGGPSPSTAVAMIILYSITGVITALFLVIIITGAVRAHRHPERYGPRNVLGRPRQSRARGLARAMLDTLPIVKFGEKDDETKPTDVELGTSTPGPHIPSEMTSARPQPDTVKGHDGEAQSRENVAEHHPERPESSNRHGDTASAITTTISTAAAAPPIPSPEPTPSTEENLGCSICTEDFERGQDVRVLPCKHSFHPACIDPWLLNVSGTCPLCRIDLRPATSEHLSPDDMPGNSTLPPPLDETDTGATRSSRRLSGFLDVLNPRRMQDASPQERLDALRRIRELRHTSPNEEAEARRRRRITLRLQDAFSIRTRQRGGAESPDGSTVPIPSSSGLGASGAPSS